MSTLIDLTSDLINKAKLATNSQQKLFNLEQVKEIIFYRDPSLLSSVIPELFQLMVERSVAIRKFLVKVAGDSLRHSIGLTPSIITLFHFLIVDGNDRVLQAIAFELANSYDKISIYVANLTMNGTGSNKIESTADPRDLWQQLRSMIMVLMETIASNRSDALRIQSIKLCENIVLFGLPPSSGTTTAAKDPRMARFSASRSLLDIPVHHQFIDRNDVEKEADALLSRLVLWARRGGPQGFPFSQTALSQLGQTIGVIAAERMSVFRKTIPALLFLIQGKDAISPVYNNPVARQQLSFLLARIIKSATGQPDPDGLLQKLQEALAALDKLNPVSASSVGIVTPRDLSSLDPRKRKLEEKAIAAALQAAQIEAAKNPSAETKGEDEDDEYRDDDEGDIAIDEESIRASAVAAVDAAESQILLGNTSKKIRIEDIIALEAPEVHESPKAPVAPIPVFVPPTPITTEHVTTNLANDIGAFPSDASTSMRLVSISTSQTFTMSKSTTSMFQSVGPPCEVYSDLAMGSLNKILHSTLDFSQPPKLKSLLHLQLLLRTTFAMAQRDLLLSSTAGGMSVASSNALSISILKSRVTSPLLLTCLKLQQIIVPMEVILPRSIWLYISSCLQGYEGETGITNMNSVGTIHSPQESNLTNDLAQKFDRLDLILALIREIFNCHQAVKEGRILGIPSTYIPLRYDDIENDHMNIVDSNQESSKILEAEENHLDDDADSPQFPLYDSICLVLFTRFIQRRVLRPSSMRILLSLPRIPLVCVRLLELLLVTGTKPVANPQTRRKGPNAPTDRGTRVAVMEIMGNLLLHEPSMNDPDIFLSTLYPLLWLATSDDFSTRSAVVNILVGVVSKIDREHEPGHGLSHVKTTILLFAQQLAMNAVGVDCLIQRMKLRNIHWEKFDDVLSSSVDVMKFLCDLDFEGNPNLLTALSSYDDGQLFGSKFQSLKSLPSDEKIELFAKRHLHLLVQLTLTRPHLLISFLDFYATITSVENFQAENRPPTTLFEEQVILLPPECGSIIRKIIRDDVLNIIPAITTSSKATDSVFDTLLQSEPLALPLLISVLDIILDDPQIPASDHMVRMVTSYYEALPVEIQDIRLLIPILGGMSREKVEQMLPVLILKLKDDPPGEGQKTKNDYLRQCFARITSARPPPLSRAHLLVALHRIDHEKHGIQLKMLLDPIGLCLAAKEEFNGEVIKDAITILLEGPTVPFVLMRTVILSAQIPEIKKFALTVVIPTLVRLKTWNTAPKVWEGVAHGVKSMIGTRDSEPTLRALLGLPLTQLRGFLKSVPTIKPFMAKVLKSLSADEFEDVITGRWAKIESENFQEQQGEKRKLINDILNPTDNS